MNTSTPMVNVEVEIFFAATQPGDSVGLIGEGPILGGWNLENKIQLDWNPENALKLNGEQFPVWCCNLLVPCGSSIHYKYVLLRQVGGALVEPLNGNRVRHVEGSPGQVSHWLDGWFGEVQSLPATPPTTMVEVEFMVGFAGTFPGDEVALCGAGTVLGDWEAGKALRLCGTDYPYWRVRASLCAGSCIEYKYAVLRKSGATYWEPLKDNRTRRLASHQGTLGGDCVERVCDEWFGQIHVASGEVLALFDQKGTELDDSQAGCPARELSKTSNSKCWKPSIDDAFQSSVSKPCGKSETASIRRKSEGKCTMKADLYDSCCAQVVGPKCRWSSRWKTLL